MTVDESKRAAIRVLRRPLVAAKHICCTASPFPVQEVSLLLVIVGISSTTSLSFLSVRVTRSLPIWVSMMDSPLTPDAKTAIGTVAFPESTSLSDNQEALPKASQSDKCGSCWLSEVMIASESDSSSFMGAEARPRWNERVEGPQLELQLL